MFGTNQIVGKKFFADKASGTLDVTSIFYTLQGEGPYGGKPAVFIRLAKCNLACSFCDTFFDNGDTLTYEEIERRMTSVVHKYWSDRGLAVPSWAMYPLNDEPGSRMVFPGLTLVITGGEPLLQENLTNFLYRQALIFENVQIESNGILDTRVPTAVTLVCSPKCAEKDGVATAYLKPSTTILRRANYLKFVISSDLSSPYSEIPSWALEWKDGLAGRDVYVSPMNVYNKLPEKAKVLREARRAADGLAPTLEERSTEDEVVSFWEKGLFNLEQNQKNHEYAARYCLEHGLRFNMQTHLFASLA